MDFYRVEYNDKAIKYIYSNAELCDIIKREFVGKRLMDVMKCVSGYEEFEVESPVFADCYCGGALLFVFERDILYFYVRGEGVVEYAVLSMAEVKISKKIVGYLLHENPEGLYCKVSDLMALPMVGQKLSSVSITATNECVFFVAGMDNEKAKDSAENCCLPKTITLVFEDGESISVAGALEYYTIEVCTRATRQLRQESFILALKSSPPNYNKARALSEKFDINLPMEDDNEESVLSEIIMGFDGDDLAEVVLFVLGLGFNLSADEDRVGAKCLISLVYSCYDERILSAARVLLKGGAKSVVVDWQTPLEVIAGKISFYTCCDVDEELADLFEALYQIVTLSQNT